MFNRQVEMKITKANNLAKPQAPISEDQFEERILYVGAAATSLAQAIAGGVVAYVITDTLRQVAIEWVKR